MVALDASLCELNAMLMVLARLKISAYAVTICDCKMQLQDVSCLFQGLDQIRTPRASVNWRTTDGSISSSI